MTIINEDIIERQDQGLALLWECLELGGASEVKTYRDPSGCLTGISATINGKSIDIAGEWWNTGEAGLDVSVDK